jgi:Delta3-Delta2-enoyl-CoA isomerase
MYLRTFRRVPVNLRKSPFKVARLNMSLSSTKSQCILDYRPLSNETKIGIIKMNRPKKKNALSQQLYKEVGNAMRAMQKDDSVKVVVLTGAGDYYSSGNDLSNFSQLMHPLTMAKQGYEILHEFVDCFISMDKPLVAAVNGPAFGIAVTTLGLCDYVVCSPSAKFKTPFAELGQAPEGCSSYSFPQIMGEIKANEVLWKGEVLDAEAARACGLVHAIEENEKDILETALTFSEHLVSKGNHEHSLINMKHHEKLAKRMKITDEAKARDIVDTLRRVNHEESAILEKAWVSKECFLALGAFLEGRRMKLLAYFMYFLNWFGFLWGQPTVIIPKPGFRN